MDASAASSALGQQYRVAHSRGGVLLKTPRGGATCVAPPHVLAGVEPRLGVALVGAVEAGTLEGHADGVVALAQGFFAALRADAQCLVAKGLALFKDVVAILALVNVDRHFVLLYPFSLGWFINVV